MKNSSALYTSLEELGLTRQEIDLYATSLKLGPSSITEIAKIIKVSRPNIYKIIASLETKGLAKFTGKKQYARDFLVEPPTTVLEKLREKIDSVKHLDHDLASELPSLLASYHQGAGPTKIKVLNDPEQYLKVMKQSLEEENKTIDIFGAETDFVYFVNWEDEIGWIHKRMRGGVKVRALMLPTHEADRLKHDAKPGLMEVKLLHDTKPFKTSFQLFANKAVIWQPKAKIALLIEDEFIVEMLRSIFETVWKKTL